MSVYRTSYTLPENPWVSTAARSYQKRLRVKNFSPLGKRLFSELVYRAVLGHDVIFRYDSAKDTIELIETTTFDTNDNPIDSNNPYARMRYVTYDGHVLDKNQEEFDDTLRCVTFVAPPISDFARRLGDRAYSLEMKTNASLDTLLFPEHYVSGTSDRTKLVLKKERELNEWKNFNANSDTKGSDLKPEVGTLQQWDIEQFLNMMKMTAFSFVQETNIPPQDLSVLDTLGVATQSLIAHRESFISRVFMLKQELQAVFNTLALKPVNVTKVSFSEQDVQTVVDQAGQRVAETVSTTPQVVQETVPTTSLVFESLFPYTPQDIASVGDAYGKGLNQNIVESYNLS